MSDIYDIYREPPQGCGTALTGGIAIILIAIMAFFSGCKTPTPIVQTVEKERIVEIHTRDTAIVTQADSASIRALLKCDSAYNVIIFDLVTLQGERINASANAQKQGKDLVLSLDCKEDSLAHIIQLQDSIIRELEKNTKIVKVRERNGYDRFTSAGFWILLVVVLAIIGVKVAKIYFKIQSGGLTSIL